MQFVKRLKFLHLLQYFFFLNICVYASGYIFDFSEILFVSFFFLVWGFSQIFGVYSGLYVLKFFGLVLSVFISILICIAFYTLAERKLMGSIQRRTGPRIVGFYGVLQPICDGIKLIIKDRVIPVNSSSELFLIAPRLVLIISLLLWFGIPAGGVAGFVDVPYSILYVFAFSALNIYGILIAGWSSSSQYAFLGSLRAAAQMISYELALSFIVVCVILQTGCLSFYELSLYQSNLCWLIFPLFPLFLVYLIVMLAETNRVPFDLAEAEAEIVAGYNVEYSAMLFAMFFLAEYANMLVLSIIGVFFFCGGFIFSGNFFSWSYFFFLFFFIFKVLVFVIFFVVVRAQLPRFRYDQLMILGWSYLLPFTFLLVIFYASFSLYQFEESSFFMGNFFGFSFVECSSLEHLIFQNETWTVFLVTNYQFFQEFFPFANKTYGYLNFFYDVVFSDFFLSEFSLNFFFFFMLLSLVFCFFLLLNIFLTKSIHFFVFLLLIFHFNVFSLFFFSSYYLLAFIHLQIYIGAVLILFTCGVFWFDFDYSVWSRFNLKTFLVSLGFSLFFFLFFNLFSCSGSFDIFLQWAHCHFFSDYFFGHFYTIMFNVRDFFVDDSFYFSSFFFHYYSGIFFGLSLLFISSFFLVAVVRFIYKNIIQRSIQRSKKRLFLS